MAVDGAVMTAVTPAVVAGEPEVLPGWGPGTLPARLDRELLLRAYRYSARAHAGQKRRSGEDYVVHCVQVARVLAELSLDSVTVAAGLIHDVVEDTAITVADVEREFGPEVATIVDGLTKIASIEFASKEERQVENYRKLLLSIARDARVIIIKLADRLHNMRTLEHMPEEKRRRIAQETLDIYAPLAHRFGMAQMRWELEDLAFKYLEPEEYRALARLVSAKRDEREALIASVVGPIREALDAAGMTSAEVSGRPKHLWSIWKKMQKRNKPYEEIYDLLAVRVMVETVPDCYHALGIIHERLSPLQERFKDYIAQPKSNGYQSLHTTVFGPQKQLFEIQIRTREMHRTADYGIAAHWRYKDDSKPGELDRHLAWFRQVLELQLDAKTPDEFLEFLKLDLYQDEIFVFTPTGDVVQLPKGATPIDFAFAVHTAVGLRCNGAKVNGRITPLSRPLKNSETVEILTAPSARPSRDWLAHVRTSRARHKIRQWLRQEEQATSQKLGREILDRELRRRRLAKANDEALDRAARTLHLTDHVHLLAAIGQGEIAMAQVLKTLHPTLDDVEEPKAPSVITRLVDRVRGTPRDAAVRIQGVDGLMIRYAQCCQPVPGDSVVGYVTRGRGVSIHRADCPNLLPLAHEPERRLDIDWQEKEGERFTVRLAIEGSDRRGLYADVASAVSGTGTDIKQMELKAIDGKAVGSMVVEVENLAHLQQIIRATRR
ncbi:MAG: bifunctional (p)ppGpp synthetase/guanosine-3',5'-bis(diphosphate) 3'-pyrophosphohydrolase, partial [Gemmatimonadaceae bacterium]|nr:bifunctional (p)ppGpp synthetase/guanosine-3',5'-bis(diphosphate) 3'-pyrophosphohydrolase [Gemmatimonadaceae bacterium]